MYTNLAVTYLKFLFVDQYTLNCTYISRENNHQDRKSIFFFSEYEKKGNEAPGILIKS